MNLSEFHFIRPYWLLSLIPYLMILTLMLKNKLQQGNWTAVCDPELLPYLLQQKAVKQSRLPLTAAAIAALLCIIALAGPTWERLPSPVFKNESAVVIALDISRTMDAEDIKPSRLIRARYKIADILKQRKDGQTALLVYAGDAFTVTPLTDDNNTIDSQLSALDTNLLEFAPGRNTALVLKRSVELLRRAGALSGHIILVTDDADIDNTMPAVKNLENYQLSILGVGNEDGAPIALPEGGFLKDEQGNIVIPKMHVNDLVSLAQAGNGVYQTISTDDRDIQTLLNFVNKPNEQVGENKNGRLELTQWDDKGPWLLLVALPLAALIFRKGLLCLALLILLPVPKNSYAFEWQDLWQTKDQQAAQAYKNNQFEQAAQKFENPDWKAAAQYKAGQYEQALETLNSDSADGAYNQGNALAQLGQLEEAIKAYDTALQRDPKHSDAKYNKELVEKELEKQKQQQQQENKDQKKDDQQEQKDQSKENSDQQSGEGKQGDKSESQDKQQSEQKSEPADQQNQQEKDAEKQSAEEKEAAKQQEQNKAEEDKEADKKDAEQAKSAEQKKEDEQKAQQRASQSEEKPLNEIEQANQQWLQRIPDDPAGLLRRKFEYQYKYEYQRKQNR